MVQTNSQKMAEAAYSSVLRRVDPTTKALPDKYASFARSFPSLVHSCGLAQAVAFASAKKSNQYLDDLAVVLNAIRHSEAASTDSLERATRELSVPAYVRLSRNTLQAASWLKRYVEASEQE
jgi:CRISPR-associated protein Cmr5